MVGPCRYDPLHLVGGVVIGEYPVKDVHARRERRKYLPPKREVAEEEDEWDDDSSELYG